MSKDIFKTKSFLFFSAFIFLILAVLVVLIFREEPDISEITGSPSALFSLNRGGPDNPENPFTRPDSDNLPVTTLTPADPDAQEPAHRPGALVSDSTAGRNVITEAPAQPEDSGQGEGGDSPVGNPDQPAGTPADNPAPNPESAGTGQEPAGAESGDSPNPDTPETPAGSEGEERPGQPGQPVELGADRPVDPTGLGTPSVLPEGAVLSSAVQEPASGNVTTKVDLAVGTAAVVLRIEANHPLSAKAFTLSDPERVVVDLSGSWKVQLPEVPANNLVATMRQGIQPDATRLVLDMREKPQSVLLEQVGSLVIELRIQ